MQFINLAISELDKYKAMNRLISSKENEFVDNTS